MNSRLLLAYRAVARRKLALVVVLLLVLENAGAAPNEQQEIQTLYRRGLSGDKAAVEECITKLEAVSKSEPSNQLARVYLGSAYTLRSRDLGFGPKKLSALKRGLAVMDEAVAAAPNEPKVRLARALTTSALPSVFGRAGESRKDFERLAQLADTQPANFEEGDLQIVHYQAGLAAKTNGDRSAARARWKKALAHPADPKLTAQIRAALAGL